MCIFPVLCVFKKYSPRLCVGKGFFRNYKCVPVFTSDKNFAKFFFDTFYFLP